MSDCVGKWRLLERLSVGFAHEAFRASQEGSSEAVVLTRASPGLEEHPALVELWLEEMRAVAQVRHPNLVRVIEWGQSDGQSFVCTEWLEAAQLRQLERPLERRSRAMAPVAACSIVSAACAGLHAAHVSTDAQGRLLRLVHRDVKPSDVFVTRKGEVKVSGLGFAATERRFVETVGGLLRGKRLFLCPEEARGDELDLRSDVFRLGLVLFQALTGRRAFAEDDELASLRALLEGPTPTPSAFVPGLPQALDDVVRRALERNPADRFASADAMRQELLAFVPASAQATGLELLATLRL